MRTLIVSMAVAMWLTGCEEQAATPTPEPPAPTGEAAPVETTAGVTTGEEVARVDPPADAPPETAGATTAAPAEAKGREAAPPKADAPAPAASAAPEPAEPTVGAEKSEPQYAAWLQSSGRYTVGKGGAVQAVLVAKEGWKCNDAYPYKFKVGAAPEGVAFASDTARGASIGKARTTLSIPFTPSSAGAKTISGKFFFSVCNESTCKIQKQDLSVTIQVDE